MASPSARNKVVGEWRHEESRTVTDRSDLGMWEIITEIADLHDTKCNTRYQDGSYRVRIEGPAPKPRSKTFVGETAWSDAARYAGDCWTKIAYSEGGAA